MACETFERRPVRQSVFGFRGDRFVRAMRACVLFATATCWLCSAAAQQLWDEQGLSRNQPQPAQRPADQERRVSSLLVDILSEDYDAELPPDRGGRSHRDTPTTDAPKRIASDYDTATEERSVFREKIAVVNKCCPVGQNLSKELDQEDGSVGRSCVHSQLTFRPIFYDFNDTHISLYDSNDIKIIVDNPCLYGKYPLDPIRESSDEFYLLINGSLLMPQNRPSMLSPSNFCMEVFWMETSPGKGEEAVALPMVCFPAPSAASEDLPSTLRLIILAIVMLISVPLLLMTAIAYFFTDELRDCHGKALAIHCACLAVAFFALAVVQLAEAEPETIGCMLSAVIIQFAFLASFTWLSIMCYDNYRSTKKHYSNADRNERCPIRMKWYHITGWGIPIVVIGLTYVVEFAPGVPLFMHKPNFGSKGCWFQTDQSTLFYFYGPLFAMFILNIIFFFLTASLLRRQANGSPVNGIERLTLSSSDGEIHSLEYDSTRLRNKSLLKNCFILSLMMGLNWTMEVITWLIGGNEWKWILFDLINAGQGIIIFYIFMKKENIKCFVRLLRARCPWISRCLPASWEPRRMNGISSTHQNGNVHV